MRNLDEKLSILMQGIVRRTPPERSVRRLLEPAVRLYADARLAKRRAGFPHVRTYCMFVGYPRSGHSLLGSLLDAHPNVVIAHELDALFFSSRGFSREQVFELLLDRSRSFHLQGGEWTGFDYSIEGQYQGGRFSTLQVIGDKRGGTSSERLWANPSDLDTLVALVGVPVVVVHHVRNPFDNIGQMYRRAHDRIELEDVVERYWRMAAASHAVGLRDDVKTVLTHHEDLVVDCELVVGRLLGEMGLAATESYLSACRSQVSPSANESRVHAPWTRETVESVRRLCEAFDFLRRYSKTEITL